MKISKPLIEIVTPAPVGSLHGNRVTALRWQGFLKKLAYVSTVTQSWSGQDVDLLIALHAFRSYGSILAFKTQFPDRPVILMLTGTDLYRDMASHPEVHQSMRMANQIVVLQSASIAHVPKKFRSKTSVIYQSSASVRRKSPPKRNFLVSVIGHLRPEKDPFCIVRSLKHLPPSSQLQIKHAGAAMSPEMRKIALGFNQAIANYQWLDEKSHADTMQLLSRSHLMVISSLMEGGAHVVTEAIAIGVPVIASDIAGNRGLLGDDYLGYYPVGNEKALAQLIHRAETDPIFYRALEKSVQARRKQSQPNTELRSIQQILKLIH